MLKTLAPLCATMIIISIAGADEPPTTEQLEKLAADKNWPELMKGATRVLQLKGTAAVSYDRAEVWVLKAEAQLQTNMFVAAAESFQDAAKEPKIDPAIADKCTAMSEVMRKTDARGFRVKSKSSAAPELIDVKDQKNRPVAMQALFESELSVVQSGLEKQRTNASLPELVKIAKSAKPLPALERAATNSQEKSDALLRDAGSLMATTITKWVDESQNRIDEISRTANENVKVEDRRDNPPDRKERRDPVYRKRGLSAQNSSDLRAVISECKQIAGAYKSFVDAAGEPGADLESIPARVEQVYKETQKILDTDYK